MARVTMTEITASMDVDVQYFLLIRLPVSSLTPAYAGRVRPTHSRNYAMSTNPFSPTDKNRNPPRFNFIREYLQAKPLLTLSAVFLCNQFMLNQIGFVFQDDI